jgi:hypothetical protein
MNIFGKLRDKIAQYFDVHIRLLKLEFIERTASVLGLFVLLTFLLLICFLALIFMGLGLASAFGALCGSQIGGYFITMFVFLLLLFLTISVRGKIKRICTNLFIRILTEQNEAEEKTVP